MSFGQLQRELKFITNHILARELKLLKEEGIIKGGPVYELTSGGKAFYESVEGIVSWAIKHAGAPDCKQQHCGNCINYSVIMASIHGRETKSKAAQ
jgi:DNA-binding HxlR family transcriptional regulator